MDISESLIPLWRKLAIFAAGAGCHRHQTVFVLPQRDNYLELVTLETNLTTDRQLTLKLSQDDAVTEIFIHLENALQKEY